jgi:hypothetical protein
MTRRKREMDELRYFVEVLAVFFGKPTSYTMDKKLNTL